MGVARGNVGRRGNGWVTVGRRHGGVLKRAGSGRRGFRGGFGEDGVNGGLSPELMGAPREPRAMREARSGRPNRSRAAVELRNGVFRRALNEVCAGTVGGMVDVTNQVDRDDLFSCIGSS